MVPKPTLNPPSDEPAAVAFESLKPENAKLQATNGEMQAQNAKLIAQNSELISKVGGLTEKLEKFISTQTTVQEQPGIDTARSSLLRIIHRRMSSGNLQLTYSPTHKNKTLQISLDQTERSPTYQNVSPSTGWMPSKRSSVSCPMTSSHVFSSLHAPSTPLDSGLHVAEHSRHLRRTQFQCRCTSATSRVVLSASLSVRYTSASLNGQASQSASLA